MTRPRWSLVLEVVGLALILGSCVLFPGTSGSDYTGTNAGSLFSIIAGAILMVIGLGPWMRSGH
jgi:hypothetical protein